MGFKYNCFRNEKTDRQRPVGKSGLDAGLDWTELDRIGLDFTLFWFFCFMFFIFSGGGGFSVFRFQWKGELVFFTVLSTKRKV